MSKYTKGDNVRLIQPSDGFDTGDTGVVNEVCSLVPLVIMNSNQGEESPTSEHDRTICVSEDILELIPEQLTPQKITSRVQEFTAPELTERMATDEDYEKLEDVVKGIKAKVILEAPSTEPNFGTKGRTISPSTSQYEDMSNKTIYVAGKMRGIPYFNFPAFDKARDRLVSEGWKVVSPADIDRESGFDALDMPLDSDWDSVDGLEGFDLFESFDRDIAAIRKCDSIYMLKGWQNSTGATAEHACAKWLLKEIIYEEEAICEEAYRIQGGDRQQDYGSPAKNFNDIADLWNSYISASGGGKLEARDVAHMMILMKVSRNIHKPKRDNWVDIAGYAQCGGKVDEL